MNGGREGGRGRHDFHVTAWLPRGTGNPRERPSVRPSASASVVRLSNHQRSPRDLNTPDAICLKTKRGKINGREYLKLSEFRAISSSSSFSFPSYSPQQQSWERQLSSVFISRGIPSGTSFHSSQNPISSRETQTLNI